MIRQPRNMAAIDAVAAPSDPTAENAATAAVKKPPVNRDAQFDPNAPQLPQAEPSAVGTAPIANPDPNAYAPPPQSQVTLPSQGTSGSMPAPTGLPFNGTVGAWDGGALAAPSPKSFTPTPIPGAPDTTNPDGSVTSVSYGSAAQPGPITPPPAMPAAGPISTLSGDWQAPTAAAGSAPLIASAAGGTMTPQGDATNAFRGYETDQDGKFGGYADPNANITGGMSFKQFDETAFKNAQSLGLDKLDYRGLPEATFNAMAQSDPGADLVKQKIVSGQPLTEQEKMYYAKVRGPELQAGVPVLGNAPANSTAADPAEQAALLAEQAAGTVPSGVGLPPIAPSGGLAIPPLSGSKWDTNPMNPANAVGGAGGMPQAPGPSAVPESAVPVGAPPADPAEQAAGLAAQGLPPIAPSGAPNIPPPAGPDTGMPQAPGPVGPPVGGESAVPVNAPPMVNNAPDSNGDVPRGTLPTAQPSASGMGNVAQTAVTPENALTNSMLARAPGADRFKIAQDQYKAAEEASAPQYEADLRRAMRLAAAGGSLGSGKLQTSIGDIAQNRDIANRSNRTNLLSEALKGTIGDQFQDVGIAERQQAFQKGQQEQAFGNEVTQASLQEALKSGDFSRALQMLTAGSTNNPSDTALALSQIFGGQSSAAGASLAQLLSGMGQKNATPTPVPSSGGMDYSSLMKLLQGFKMPNVDITPQAPNLSNLGGW